MHLFSSSNKTSKTFFLFLTILAGIWVLWPFHDFQHYLAQGDHGRDLYAFSVTMEGQAPYKDYWWVYGPLMPLYYSLFFKILGISVKSVLLGKLLLTLLSGIFIFLTLSLMISPFFALMGAVWFWIFQPDFFFTYNHAGGITMLMAATFCLFLYFQNTRTRYLYGALTSIFILSLIKINFGLAIFFPFLIILYTVDKVQKIPISPRKKIFYIVALTLFPFLLMAIYSSLIKGLPAYAIRQCFPYLSSDHPHNASIGTALMMWWHAIAININVNWFNRLFALLLITSIFKTFWELLNKKGETMLRQKMIFAISVLTVLYLVTLHEYLVSAVLYRTFWAKPFSTLLVFLFIGFAVRKSPKILQGLLLLAIFSVGFFTYNGRVKVVNLVKKQGHSLSLPRGQITTMNKGQWFDTVRQATNYLQAHLKDNETFFALPYDPLYYFLAQKTSPTRQLIFFKHINIPRQQEKKIINELKEKRVNYVLLSNRSHSAERGLGIFGETYCPLLAQYISNNFREIAEFGDWKNLAGWAWNHGVRILKRKN